MTPEKTKTAEIAENEEELFLTDDELFPSLGNDDDEKTVSDETPFDETELEPLDFAKPQTVKLKDGTACEFRIPDLQSEERSDALRKTTTVVSPTKINGKNPYTETTDHLKADIRYFLDNAEKLHGFTWFDETESRTVDAKETAATEQLNGRDIKKTFAHLIPIQHQRSFGARLYGGKLEIWKPEEEKEAVRVGGERLTIVKHSIGIEENKDGTLTNPDHVIYYYFREPDERIFSRWGKASGGYKLPLEGGGFQQTQSFYTKKIIELYSALIVKVEGAVYNGKQIENPDQVPIGVRRNSVVIAFGHWLKDVGNE